MDRRPVEVPKAAEPSQVCVVVEAVVALMFVGLPPPVDATPEQTLAVQQVNALLAQRRETIMGLDVVKEMGCG
jgi:hypothetical protein